MEMERPREKLVRGTGSLSAAQCLWLHIVVSGTMAVWNPETLRGVSWRDVTGVKAAG
jgi:hypothetical protein